MALRTDFLIDTNAELIIKNGDFVFGQSDEQHIQDTINAIPGWWKEFPLDGVAVITFINSPGGGQGLSRRIQIELEKDGYRVDHPVIEFSPDGKLNIYPNATIV